MCQWISSNDVLKMRKSNENHIKFQLLYRGSKDGFTSKNFHSLCDNKAPTLMIMKSDKGQVFGGYTSETWNVDNKYKNDSTAFLFSLTLK